MEFGIFRRRNNSPAANRRDQDLPDLEQAINLEGEDPLAELQNSMQMIRTGLSPIEARSGWIQASKLVVWTLYIFLFVWGNILIFFSHSECSKGYEFQTYS